MIPSAACELIYQKAKAGLARRKEIAPYKIRGPVTVGLFDSDSHAPPLELIHERVTADTINEAFLKCEKTMPWSYFDSENLDPAFHFPGNVGTV